MRLINVHSRLLHEFYDAEVPPYAILSHTWGEDEVSYEDITSNQARDKDAYRKIRFLCTEAVADGLEWAWLDTCCINKTSSAELSEAINSMFRWYRRAECCYAYLIDIPGEVFWQNKHNYSTGSMEVSRWLPSSNWFMRGWCLQELIAPPKEKFYGRQWNYLGDRDQLAPLISRITGIREKILLNPEIEVSRCSIAEKMSWAAKRKTSRVEDTAYCLLGIFEVNMPMLYGEGMRAFARLQEEIIRSTDDHSIFVWQPLDSNELNLLLAPEPSRFANGALVVTIPALHHVQGHTLGNTGLRISLPMHEVEDRPGCFHAVLGCRYRDDYQNVIALCLQRRAETRQNEADESLPSALFVAPTIARAQRCVVERAPRRFEDLPGWPSLMISRTLPVAEAQKLSAGSKYWFDPGDEGDFSIVAAYPPEAFNSQTSVMDLTGNQVHYGAVLLSLSQKLASAAGYNEKTWRSRSVAVVFGGWEPPGKQFDEANSFLGIFGVVRSDLRNLENATRLAVSRSIFRSSEAETHHVAWVRSTINVQWTSNLRLDVSFKEDRRIGILSEVVNIISMRLRPLWALDSIAQMPLYQQLEESDGNPLSVERLQDFVRSSDESELDDRRVSFEGPRAGEVYELEGDVLRALAPDYAASDGVGADEFEIVAGDPISPSDTVSESDLI